MPGSHAPHNCLTSSREPNREGHGSATQVELPLLTVVAMSEKLAVAAERERAFVMNFTKKCFDVLMSEESINLLAQCKDQQEIGQLSVIWQRELIEHFGVQMDFGCQKLGDVPRRFSDDTEVMQSFMRFQQACGESAQKAIKLMHEIKKAAIRANVAKAREEQSTAEATTAALEQVELK